MLGAMFSTNSFSMYWPKKGHAWNRIYHAVGEAWRERERERDVSTVMMLPWLGGNNSAD